MGKTLRNGKTISTFSPRDIMANGAYNIEQVIKGDTCVLNITDAAQPLLQDKSISITENGSSIITADNGYSGLSQVNVTTNVQASDPNYKSFVERSTNNVVIPNGTTKIGAYAFYNWNDTNNGTNNGLRTVTLPQGLTEIGRNAFNGCSNLTSINLPNNITDLSNASIFNGCTNLQTINLSNITKFGANIFNGCQNLLLNELNPNTTLIDSNAFYNCQNVTFNTIPSSVNGIKSQIMYRCNAITGEFYVLPSDVSVSNSVIVECNNITKIYWNPKRTNTYSIWKCAGLTELVMTNTSWYNFYSNFALECPALNKISFPNALSVPTFTGNVSNFPTQPITIEVPSALLNTWKTATNWVSLTNVTWVGI